MVMLIIGLMKRLIVLSIIGVALFAINITISGYSSSISVVQAALTECAQNPFPDTVLSAEEGKAACQLYLRGVIKGFPDGEFKGSLPVNRAEAAKFVLKACNKTETAEYRRRFKDVPKDQWYTSFVEAAAEQGIIDGNPDGTFRPANKINRVEFLKMLSKACNLKANLDYSFFRDIKISDWFVQFAGVAQKYLLYSDSMNDRFLKPSATLTRKEIAIAIYRLIVEGPLIDKETLPFNSSPTQSSKLTFPSELPSTSISTPAPTQTSTSTTEPPKAPTPKPTSVTTLITPPVPKVEISPASAPTCAYPNWVNGQAYVAGNIVKYINGNFYKASHDNPGYDPIISTWYWDTYICTGTLTTATPASASTTLTSAGFVVTEEQFNKMFPNRNAFYSYAGLLQAITFYPAFAMTGTDTVKKQEAAAFFANVNQETGALEYIREINKDNWPRYCSPSSAYPCASGQQYYGRGPLQISWNYNYGAAGAALGLNLLGNPDLVATESSVAWKTSLWYWMTQKSGAMATPHDSMVNSTAFSETIRAINGDLECNTSGSGHAEMLNRVQFYKNFTSILGVAPGSNLTC